MFIIDKNNFFKESDKRFVLFLIIKIMKLYNLIDTNKKIFNCVKNLEWKRKIPGGWLKYGPPREVCAYGDGSLYTDDGKKYGPKYKETAWAGAIPLNQTTLVVKTEPLPKELMKTTLMKQLRNCLKDYGADVDDSSCTGMWCNYYSQITDNIAPHKDDENYYQRNYKNQPLFVSLTFYEDENESLENVAKFQIKNKEDKWETIKLPHSSLLVMGGNIEHRVLKPSKNNFRKRYNITFRTPVKMKDDLIKNYRFFSNFGRYYKIPYKVFLPLDSKENLGKYKEIIESFKHLVKLKIEYNQKVDRKEILKILKSKAPHTTTNMALYILCKNI